MPIESLLIRKSFTGKKKSYFKESITYFSFSALLSKLSLAYLFCCLTLLFTVVIKNEVGELEKTQLLQCPSKGTEQSRMMPWAALPILLTALAHFQALSSVSSSSTAGSVGTVTLHSSCEQDCGSSGRAQNPRMV